MNFVLLDDIQSKRIQKILEEKTNLDLTLEDLTWYAIWRALWLLAFCWTAMTQAVLILLV